MTEDDFWDLIEAARAQDGGSRTDAPPAKTAEAAAAILAVHPVDRVLAFDRMVWTLMDRSYRNNLWAAGYLINGGCSDDGFDYFRGWLMAQGRDVWDQALADPDSLADQFEPGDEGDVECGAMLVVAAMAYERATGEREGF